MPTVGTGVAEIRIHGRQEHRIIYVAKFQEAVYVLHASRRRVAAPGRRTWTWHELA